MVQHLSQRRDEGNDHGDVVLNVSTCPTGSLDEECDGYEAVGYDSLVNGPAITGDMQTAKRPLNDISQIEQLVWPVSFQWGQEQHFTWSNLDIHDRAPVCASTYNYEGDTSIDQAFAGEILCIETDGLASTVWLEWTLSKLLENGISVAGIDVGESYGSPSGTSLYSEFYRSVLKAKRWSAKPCLLARSRGGLMLYNWALANPTAVACIAGILSGSEHDKLALEGYRSGIVHGGGNPVRVLQCY